MDELDEQMIQAVRAARKTGYDELNIKKIFEMALMATR